ncbi:MAG: PEP-CTERM sorting domain-containing protein, partial [Verrucomicrobiota bacterium]
PRLYHSIFTLSNTISEVLSVSITNNGNGHSAILAISGEAIPEPTAGFLLAAGCGALGLVRFRRM